VGAREYILSKQIQWAVDRGITLIGSKGKRGRPTYTTELNDNLFEPLEPGVRECFEKGDGNEINGSPECPAKMQAVHSSSALSVNVFQYWQKINQPDVIAAACGFCPPGNHKSGRIVFEDKYPIGGKEFGVAPNIDVVIHNTDNWRIKRFAIECKFTEAYSSRRQKGMKPKYISRPGLWEEIPALYELAKSLCPDDDNFHHLHPAQLVKHILGLKKACGKDGFELLYLWYDVSGKEGVTHRKEIECFSEIAKSDGVKFHALSYQELIVKLSHEVRPAHGEYIEYISNRYL
jgi:hypothetical protein